MSSGDVTSTDKTSEKIPDPNPDPTDWPPIHPWHLMAAAGGSALLMGATVWVPSLTFFTVLFMLIALIAAGGAVWLRPRCALLLLAAAGVALLVSCQMRPAWDFRPIFGPRPIVHQIDPTAWDSARAVTLVLTGLALFAAGMVSLPRAMGWLWARFEESPAKANSLLRQRGEAFGKHLSRAIISVFVLMHFTGISCAFLSVPPPMRDQSWVAQWGWTIMQPYLQFMYLVNAYRFYSPEPGPASVMWYYVIYEDGTCHEEKIPNRKDHSLDPLGQEYTRRLSISENVNQLVPLPGIPDQVKHRRITWGDPKFNAGIDKPIPLHPQIPPDLQYRVPQESSKLFLREYARKIAQMYPHPENKPSVGVRSVLIYRVTHRMLEPSELVMVDNRPRPFTPTDPWTYLPYYQGEFVPPPAKVGQEPDLEEPWVLKDPDDPFLYWLIPIWYEVRPNLNLQNPNAPAGNQGFDLVTVDCHKEHVLMKVTEPKGGKQ